MFLRKAPARVTPRVLLALTVAGLLLAFAIPAQAANSETFSDPAGDNDVRLDIRSVTVTSGDDGSVEVAVTVSAPPCENGTPCVNDSDGVSVGFDFDQNANTGDELGVDEGLVFYGTTAADHVDFNDATGSFVFEPITTFDVAHPSTDMFVFTGRFSQGGWFTVRFAVFATYQQDGEQVSDIAPDQGFFTYDVRADPDGDGVSGTDDECRTRAGGAFDRDGDGCPGPYLTLPTPVPRFKGSASGSSITFTRFWVTSVPRAATVTVRAGSATFRRRGSGVVFRNRTFAVGQRITIAVSQAGSCSRQLVIKTTSTGYAQVSNRVIRPGGIRCR